MSFSGCVSSRAAASKSIRPQVECLEERTVLDSGLTPSLIMTPSTRLVTGLYYDLLNRQPTADEVLGWANALDRGLSHTDLANGFLNGAEFRSIVIRQDYQEFLKRAPEDGAIDSWQARIANGLTSQQLMAQLAASDEYFQQQGSRAGQWIASLYQEFLGRAADPQGLAFWTEQLAKRGANRLNITNSFVFSSEGLGQQITNAYQEILGRNPDPFGYNAWLAAMQQQKLTLDQLRLRLVASQEYADQQNGVDLPVSSGASSGSSGSNSGSGSSGGLSVGLTAPSFTTDAGPTVNVQVSLPNYSGRVRIDVDLNHNGSFADAGEQFFTTGTITPQAHSVTLNPLPGAGTFDVRAVVRDSSGRDVLSSVVNVTEDPNSGILGSSALSKLHDNYVQALNDNSDAILPSFIKSHNKIFTFDAQQRVKVNIQATQPQFVGSMQSDLQKRGMVIANVYPEQNLITGFLPMSEINNLTTLANFHSATPVYAPIFSTGSVTTQGDKLIKADSFRRDQSVDGTGVKVGVLSDSANQVDSNGDGVKGIAESQKTGDLPKTGIEILKDGPSQGATDEGRAMMEIVNDIAPAAKLAFYTGSESPQDFAKGIQTLAKNGANVIVDDVGYLDSPFFNDGVISQAVDKVAGQGVFYVSAAGNDGKQGYLTSWKGITTTVAGTQGTYLDVGSGSALQKFSLSSQKSFQLSFQWDNAFLEGGSTQNNYRVKSEVDVLVLTADGSRVLAQFNDNTLNTNEAVQIGSFLNDGSFGTNNFSFAFKLAQGPAPTMVRWVALGDDPKATGEGGPTIFGQPTAKGAVAVGAVAWNNTKTPESFSSQGGAIPILFDATGKRLAQPEMRNKPEVAAPDGVSTSFFGSTPAQGDPDRTKRFFGTSASAPHAAAAAALLKQQYPTASNTVLNTQLEKTAAVVGSTTSKTSSSDFSGQVGAGIIQLQPITATTTGSSAGSDVFEPNDSSDLASIMGVLTAGNKRYDGLTIQNHASGLADMDWFRWKADRSGSLSVNISYQNLNGGDLHLRVYRQDSQNNLIQLGSSRQTGVTGQKVTTSINAGDTILVWVYGFNHAEAPYSMVTNLV